MDLLHRIVLNDAAKYEEVALEESKQFVDKMFKFYNTDLPVDFKKSYCKRQLKMKQEKFKAPWKKYICQECNTLELNG